MKAISIQTHRQTTLIVL